MRHVKSLLFLTCCFLVGMGIATAIVKYMAYRKEVAASHTGVGDPPPLHGFYLPAQSASATLPQFAPLHATAVALEYPPASSASLTAAVADAHRRGLKVVLLPPPVFSETNPYPKPLQAIAAEAHAARVDVLCLSWLNSDADKPYWITQAAEVRTFFKGPLIIAATPAALRGIDFADACDYLGVIGPVPIARRLPHAPDNVDLQAMRMFWECALDELESFAVKSGRPLVLLHMAIPVTNRAKLPLPGVPPPTPTPDPKLQAISYEALLLETKGRTSVEGLFLPLAPDPAANPAVLPKIENLWSQSSAGSAVTPPATATAPATSETPPPEEDATDPFQ